MEQTIKSGNAKTIQGSVLIIGAIAVGVGAGLGLNMLLPKKGEEVLIEHTSSESEEATSEESSSEQASAPASESESTSSESTTTESTESEAPAADAAETTSADTTAAEPENVPEVTFSEPEAPAPSEPAPAPAPEVAAAPVEPVAPPPVVRSAPKPAATPVKKAAPITRSAPPPASQVLRSWWETPSGDVQYVGQVQGQPAVAVLFSGNVADASALNNGAKLFDADGKQVQGSWQATKNPRLAIMPNLKPGRYTLLIEQGANGQSLRAPLRGPVFIQ